MCESWVAHLLVLCAGDIIRGYCPTEKQHLSSPPIQGTRTNSDTCTTLLCYSVLCAYVHKKVTGTYTE